MNEKMTFPELVDAVAAATDTSKKVSETFLKELFSTIADTLRNGENVKVKGLGVFKLTAVDARKSVNVNTGEEMEIPSHRKVSFIPDKALAEAVNLPFASFETVVLSDDLTESDLKKMAEVDEEPDMAPPIEETKEEPKEEPKIVPPPFLKEEETVSAEPAGNDGQNDAVEDKECSRPIETAESAEVSAPNNAEETVADKAEPIEESTEAEVATAAEGEADDSNSEVEPVETQVQVKQPLNAVDDDDEEEEYLPQPKNDNSSFMRGFLWGAVTMFFIYLLVGGGIYWYKTNAAENAKMEAEMADSMALDNGEAVNLDSGAVDSGATEAVETEEKVVAQPENEPEVTKIDKPTVKYDTITKTKFLTRLAKKYYGNSDFWVYIYEENKAKIKNPNTISPGTVVVIPPAEKYGIDKDNAESLKNARKKAAELEKRYR